MSFIKESIERFPRPKKLKVSFGRACELFKGKQFTTAEYMAELAKMSLVMSKKDYKKFEGCFKINPNSSISSVYVFVGEQNA